MTLDFLASVTLAAQALLLPMIIVISSRLDGVRRAVVLAIAGGWLLLLAGLSAAGFFSARGYGTPFVGVAVAVPVIAVLLLRSRSATLHSLMTTTIPLTMLVAVHVGRLLGVEFLLMQAAGRLPATFASAAGWGDIIVAAASLPLAFAVHRRIPGWRSMVLAWNCVGVADLIVAVALGAGSAAGSPIRFLYEEPSSALMGTLPWFLIPGYLVPLYLVSHVAIFFRLAAADPSNVPTDRPNKIGLGSTRLSRDNV